MPNLTLTGSPTFNGDSSCTIDSTGSDRVFCDDPSLLSFIQSWFAVRVKPSYTHSDANERSFFRYGPDTNNELFLQYGPTAGALSYGRDGAGGAGGQPVINGITWTIGDSLTFVGYASASICGVSFNGGAFTTATNSRDTFSAATGFDIGQRGYSATGIIDADVHWAAGGRGIITDADAATLHAFGNTDPTILSLPGEPTFLWKCNDITYENIVRPAKQTSYYSSRRAWR